MSITFHPFVTREQPARFAMSRVIAQWCANTGFVDFAKRAMTASFSMNTTCPKCQSVISIQSLVSVYQVVNLELEILCMFLFSLLHLFKYHAYKLTTPARVCVHECVNDGTTNIPVFY